MWFSIKGPRDIILYITIINTINYVSTEITIYIYHRIHRNYCIIVLTNR